MYLPGLSGIAAGFAQGFQSERDRQERAGDKAYDRQRQTAADARAQQSHDMQMNLNQNQLDASKLKADQDKEEYQRLHTWQQHAAPLMSAVEAGDTQGALSSFSTMANDPVFGLPYKTDFTRDEQGNIVIGKDGKAEAIHAWDDGRVQKVMVNPNDVITASMAMYNPAVLAKMRMENQAASTAKQSERAFKLKEMGIQQNNDLEKIRVAKRFDLQGKLIDSQIDANKDQDKPLSSSDIKTLFTKDEVIGKDPYGEPKIAQRLDTGTHRAFIQWANQNKRQTTMRTYNDWLASTGNQARDAQPNNQESKAIAWVQGKGIGSDQSKLNEAVKELRNQKWSDDQILKIFQNAGVKLDGDK